jgi:hypothetical protein
MTSSSYFRAGSFYIIIGAPLSSSSHFPCCWMDADHPLFLDAIHPDYNFFFSFSHPASAESPLAQQRESYGPATFLALMATLNLFIITI